MAAVKQFKKTKALSTLRKEYSFLERAADAGAAPTPYEIDGAQRRFYMRAMSQTLPEVLASQDGALTGPQSVFLNIFLIPLALMGISQFFAYCVAMLPRTCRGGRSLFFAATLVYVSIAR